MRQQRVTRSRSAAESLQLHKPPSAAEALSRETETALRCLLEATPAPALLADCAGTVLTLNHIAAKSLGQRRGEIVGRPAYDLFSARVANRAKVQLAKAVRTGEPACFAEQRARKRRRYVVYPVLDSHGKVVRVAITAISPPQWRLKSTKLTDRVVRLEALVAELKASNEQLQADLAGRKRVQKALRESEARYRAVVEGQTELICRFLPDGTLTFVNPSYCRYFGKTPDELIGQSLYPLVFAEDRECVRKAIATLGPENRVLTIEYRVFDPRTGHRLLQWTNQAVLDKDGELIEFQAVGRDITEHRLAQDKLQISREQLRRLSTHLQLAREEERSRIAREIHDELGQTMTALKMDVSWIRRRITPGQKSLIQRIKATSASLEECIRTVQRISSELRPGVLDHLGLGAAVEWQANEFQDRTGIRCTVKLDPEDKPLDQERSTAIFRVVQEALTNVARHANATHVKITLTWRPGKVILMVVDNGKGVTEQQISDPSSLGLLGMRERVYSHRGDIFVSGVEGRGTVVRVLIPLEREEEES